MNLFYDRRIVKRGTMAAKIDLLLLKSTPNCINLSKLREYCEHGSKAINDGMGLETVAFGYVNHADR